jgi:hypothetical protein
MRSVGIVCSFDIGWLATRVLVPSLPATGVICKGGINTKRKEYSIVYPVW